MPVTLAAISNLYWRAAEAPKKRGPLADLKEVTSPSSEYGALDESVGRTRNLAKSAVPVLIVGLLIGVVLVADLFRQADGDPFVLVAVGSEQDFPRSFIEAELDRTVTTRPGLGHDGQPFFLQALDPLYRDSRSLQVDNPVYRGQRLVYPLLAGLGGLLPLRLIPWGMATVQVLSLGFGAYLTARVAMENGQGPWWGLSFPLNPGVWAAVQIGGSGSLALGFGIGGVLCVMRGRYRNAAILLALSALTREVMLAMAIGLFIQEWRRSGRPKPSLVVFPTVCVIAWGAYLRLQIDGSYPAGGGAVGPPFRGLAEAIRHWADSPTELIFGILTIVCALVVVTAAVLTTDLMAAAAAPFCLLLVVLSVGVLRESFDYSRALLPLFTAAVMAIAIHVPRSTTRDIRLSTT